MRSVRSPAARLASSRQPAPVRRRRVGNDSFQLVETLQKSCSAWPSNDFGGVGRTRSDAIYCVRALHPCTAAETDKWKKISYVFMPFCVCYGVFVYIKHNQHHHEHEDVRCAAHSPSPSRALPLAHGACTVEGETIFGPPPALLVAPPYCTALLTHPWRARVPRDDAGAAPVPVDEEARQGDAVDPRRRLQVRPLRLHELLRHQALQGQGGQGGQARGRVGTRRLLLGGERGKWPQRSLCAPRVRLS